MCTATDSQIVPFKWVCGSSCQRQRSHHDLGISRGSISKHLPHLCNSGLALLRSWSNKWCGFGQHLPIESGQVCPAQWHQYNISIHYHDLNLVHLTTGQHHNLKLNSFKAFLKAPTNSIEFHSALVTIH
jgi:hypothetical protein